MAVVEYLNRLFEFYQLVDVQILPATSSRQPKQSPLYKYIFCKTIVAAPERTLLCPALSVDLYYHVTILGKAILPAMFRPPNRKLRRAVMVVYQRVRFNSFISAQDTCPSPGLFFLPSPAIPQLPR